MISSPGENRVSIPGHGKSRINAAYPIGEQQIGPGYGPALAKKTVSQLVGVPVQHFVLINFEGFKALIDKLDGVYIDVEKPIDDSAYPTDEFPGDTRTIKIHFDAGLQLMDGKRALIYARTRHADSDFGRNQCVAERAMRATRSGGAARFFQTAHQIGARELDGGE